MALFASPDATQIKTTNSGLSCLQTEIIERDWRACSSREQLNNTPSEFLVM
jgi:hypothetical protein